MMRKSLITGLMALCLTGLAWADFNMTDWEFSKPVDLGNVRDGYARLDMDSAVWSHAQHNLSDLRIIDSRQIETPYKLVINNRTVQETAVPAKILNKTFVPRDRTVFTLDMSQSEMRRNNKLSIQTPDRNYKCRVEIIGSEDQADWLVLRNDCYIFDISTKDFHSSYTVLEYPENNYPYLKVSIMDNSDKPMNIAGVTLYYSVIKPAEEQLLAQQIISRTADARLKVSEYILDFGTSGQPQSRLEIATDNDNYHRKVEILGADKLNPILPAINEKYQSADPNNGWAVLGSGYIYKFNTPNLKSSQANISYQENHYQFLKVRIFNYDDAPLGITDKSIAVYGVIRRVVFSVVEGAQYALHYGNLNAVSPVYDLEKFFPYIDASAMKPVKLSAEIRNVQYIARTPQKPWSEEHAYLLWVFIGIGIVVLGFIIFKWSKTIAETER
jgi:hypothetical protein